MRHPGRAAPPLPQGQRPHPPGRRRRAAQAGLLGLTARATAAEPLLQPEVDAALDALGPFEDAPALAVAVSGGADSLAAALLCDTWARARGGTATALTVDHGLRPESGSEAARTRDILRGRGIDTHVLPLGPTGGRRNLQAAARAGRYAALTGWCRKHGVLHLVTAHQRGDQAETVFLRLMRGSAVDGLSAIPAVQPAPGCRILRPLLGIEPARLRAFLRARDVDWIEDPSNRDARFQRVRVRRALARLDIDIADRVAALARDLGGARRDLERAADALCLRAVRLMPEGYARIDPARLAGGGDETGLRALARTLRCVGGLDHAPRFARLHGLYLALRNGEVRNGRTLGGCRIAPAGTGSGVVVCREAARAPTVPLGADETLWDGRFALRSRDPVPEGSAMTIGPLNEDGWAACLRAAPWLRATQVPHAARLALPAVRRGGAVVAVPSLNFDAGTPEGPAEGPFSAAFRPRRPLCGAAFRPVAPAGASALAAVR